MSPTPRLELLTLEPGTHALALRLDAGDFDRLKALAPAQLDRLERWLRADVELAGGLALELEQAVAAAGA